MTSCLFVVVSYAIGIGVGCAVTTTHAQGVELVAFTVAVSFGDVSATTLVDVSRTVADAASIEFTNTFVYVVTDAIGIGVVSAVTTAHAQGVELVSIAVAVAFRDAVTCANAALV